MNIISNNCTAGFIYKNVLKTEYQHPFIWCRFFNDDFLYLIQHYDSINFHNYEIGKYGAKLHNKTNPFYIRVNDKVSIHYTHYYFDSTASTPITTKSHDILYNKIWELIVSNYKKRLERLNGKPSFIFNDDESYSIYGANKTWINIIPNLIKLAQHIDNKCVIISNKYKPMQENNLLILNADNIWPPYNLDNNNGSKIVDFLED